MARFKILLGRHIGKDGRLYAWCEDPRMPPSAGNIIETDEPLDKIFNTEISRKFERMDVDQPEGVSLWDSRTETLEQFVERMKGTKSPAQAPGGLDHGKTLEGMTVKELQAYAAEEEIDVRGLNVKEALVAKIRASEAKVARV